MSAFNGMKLTNNGKDLLSRTLSGHELEFTAIKMGDGNAPSNVATLNDLVNTKHILPIYNLRKFDTDKVLVGSVLQGSQITQGFNWKEIGVFAHDKTINDTPILFAYDNCGSNSSYIPQGGGSVLEQVINVEMIISNEATISAKINESLAYLLKKNPTFEGVLQTGNTIVIKVDTNIEIGDKKKNVILNTKNKLLTNVNGKEQEVITTEQIVIGNTQPNPIPGKIILWFDTRNN